MFQTTVKEAFKVPGFDYYHVVGVDSKGSARIGDFVTDGNVRYEITSIPLIRKNSAKPMDEVDICIHLGDNSINALVGKTLYASPQT